MARKQTQSPRIGLFLTTALSGLFLGTLIGLALNPTQGRRGVLTGLLAGTVLTATVAATNAAQAHRDRQVERQEQTNKLRKAQYETQSAQEATAKAAQRTRHAQAQANEAQATARIALQKQKHAIATTRALELRFKSTQAALQAAYQKADDLRLQLRSDEASIQARINVAVSTERGHVRMQAKQMEAAKNQEIAALQQQIKATNTALQEAQAEVEEWEQAFETRLQVLVQDEAETERQRITAEVKRAYEARIVQVFNTVPEAIKKRCEKQRLKWTAALQADLETVTAEKNQALQQIARYKEEFVGLTADLEASLGDKEIHEALQNQVEVLQGALSEKNRTIQNCQAAIAQLESPRLFPGGYDHHRGNILIRHAQAQGVTLDALHRSRNTEAGLETYYFAARHPEPPRDVLGRLNGQSLKLQHELDSKKIIQFEYDTDSLTYRCSVQLFQKRLTRDEIDRKWLKASKFKALVKEVCAFRVSANKGGSKSPTVRNILGAKLLEGEKFKIRRYDPSAGSRKDYWRVAPTWRSYHDALKMAAEIESLILRRQREKSARQGAEFDWVYYVIDELDNTMSTLAGEVVVEGEDEISAAKVVINAIAKAVKEGEHLQIGIIICTQTPNVRQLMKSEVIDKAFFNNLAQIVVEANVFDYLSSSTDQTKSPRLASDYRAVYDWCDKENEAIMDEARKYRPALFVSKAKREIIELPPLGEFGFDKLDSTKPYDFEEFNAYEYAGARSLDQALLMASKEQVERTSLLPTPASDMAQTAANNGLGGGEIQTHQSNGNVAVVVDPKILPKTEGAPTCPICGDTLKPNGKGRGTYKGMKQFACRSQDHTSQMGGKTFYQKR